MNRRKVDNRKVFKKAHELTRRFVEVHGTNYSDQFAIVLKWLYDVIRYGDLSVQVRKMKENAIRFSMEVAS